MCRSRRPTSGAAEHDVRLMRYTPQHAAQALEIIRRLLPYVTEREEYRDLISILGNPTCWKDAHDQFSKIRTNITLPFEREKRTDLDAFYVFVAENAAKTAYNCSGEPAPFDSDSFRWLLRCEKEFLEKMKNEANHVPQPTPNVGRG